MTTTSKETASSSTSRKS